MTSGESHCLLLLFGVAAGFQVVSSFIKAHPLFLSASISKKDTISSENSLQCRGSAPWNVMTHPSNRSLVSCQQISVLSLPVSSLLAPPGSCPSREQHQGCSPGNTPSPDLLPQNSPSHQLNSRTASHQLGKLCLLLQHQEEMAGTEFIHCCQQNLRQKLLGPVLNQLGYPSHPDLFYVLIKANKDLEQTTWMALGAESLSGCLAQQRNCCKWEKTQLPRQGKEHKTPAYLCFISNLVHLY